MAKLIEGQAVDVVYMDFWKAFDKVPDGGLVQKIKSYRIHNELKSVNSGVLHGSVLGPDLDETAGGLIRKFADDMQTSGVVGSEECCQRIQQDIDQLESWAEKQQLEFNPDR
eukprot:g34418.t1